jgi:hypothetical protein
MRHPSNETTKGPSTFGASGGLGLLLMVRHAGPVRPTLTTTTGALAVAALAASGLSLYHHVDAAVMVLVWHVGATAAVVAMGHLAGPGQLRWIVRGGHDAPACSRAVCCIEGRYCRRDDFPRGRWRLAGCCGYGRGLQLIKIMRPQ